MAIEVIVYEPSAPPSNTPLLGRVRAFYRELSAVGKIGFLLAFLGIWHRFGGKLVVQNGKLISYMPYCEFARRCHMSRQLTECRLKVVAPIAQHAFFFQNMMFEVLCNLQKKFFPNPPPSEPADLEKMKKQILDEKDVAFNESDYERLFESLPTLKSDRLVGRCFDGRMLRTNRSVLDLAEWVFIRPVSLLGIRWGKRFMGTAWGDPLLFNWGKRIYVPLPTAGGVGLKDVTYANGTSATMSYDSYQWNDHFRILQDDSNQNGNDQSEPKNLVLLGAWAIRDKIAGYFTLTHDPSTPVSA